MPHVFVSYSRRDAAYADSLISSMQRAGCRVWIDRKGISAGDQWRREIVEAIQKAGLFILVLSPNAARSDNVRKELDLAESARVRMLPVAVAPTDIPDHMKYQLAGLQILPFWREQERGTANLLHALKKYGLTEREKGARPARRAAVPPPSESGIDLSHLGGGGLIEGWFRRKRN